MKNMLNEWRHFRQQWTLWRASVHYARYQTAVYRAEDAGVNVPDDIHRAILKTAAWLMTV